MQEFTDLINHCYQQYTTISPCSDCAMGNCRKNECEDCYNCLKHIHLVIQIIQIITRVKRLPITIF